MHRRLNRAKRFLQSKFRVLLMLRGAALIKSPDTVLFAYTLDFRFFCGSLAGSSVSDDITNSRPSFNYFVHILSLNELSRSFN